MSYPVGLLPVLPLKNTVIYPGITQTLRVGRDKSKKAVDLSSAQDGWIFAVAQKDAEANIESEVDLNSFGTLCKVESIKITPDSSYFVVVRGYHRAHAVSYATVDGCYQTNLERHDDVIDIDKATEGAFLSSLKAMGLEILKVLPGNTESMVELVKGVDDLALLGHLAAANIDLPLAEKQKILEDFNLRTRTLTLLNILQEFKQTLIVQNDIRNKLSSKLGQTQREHILREQLKTIKEELGDEDTVDIDDEYQKKIDEAKMPEEAHKLAMQQLRKLSNSSTQSPEYQMIRTHLDLMVSLPWSQSAGEKDFNLDDAEAILNADHYGLDKIKKRILQHLAVIKRRKNKKGSILLFIGPPGVGKTSLGQSIARALGKKYHRLSLGGVRDESEIRGHRRTYIGALPGKIISALSKVKQNDALFLLDEVDKLSRSYGGDPAAALLEVLDPEQNSAFADHYLDTSFDLSKIFFIATANSLEGIPAPLLDRMEIIDLTGYTSAEKFNIAKSHIIPKQMDEYSFQNEEIQISDEALLKIVTHYTRESGVRDLQRKVSEIFRYASEKLQRGQARVTVGIENLEDIFGPERFTSEVAEFTSTPGVVTGLAWTPVGGDILFIETALVPGKGDLIITGQLGEVMRESAQIAKSLVRSRLSILAPHLDLNKFDIHLHVPSGGIPKDGPSAGITILTSIASLVSRVPVEPKLAMTGEISLRGKVLPVGGIKEKVIAAHRAGVRQIILCEQNKKDLREIPEDIKTDIQFHFVNHINEVLSVALKIDLKDWTDDLFFTVTSGIGSSTQEVRS
ncbi:MAG: endopeptidase La [Bdellovibrionaceae bacterium]|nr:endopeptidase La [Pseudobdellovibrionaceae bacterium]